MTIPWLIREIEDSDVAQVVALWSASGLVQAHHDPAADIALARRDKYMTVIVGEAVAQVLAAAIVTAAAGRYGEAYYIAVAPGSQGRGLGRALVTAVETWLMRRDVHMLRLRVDEQNANAAAFYRHLGYQMTGRLYMEKHLPRPGNP